MNSKDIAVTAVFCTAILGMLLRPLVMAWARSLNARAVAPDLVPEVDELRQRVAELEGTHQQVQELAERLDFAERLLAQRGDRAELPLNRTPV